MRAIWSECAQAQTPDKGKLGICSGGSPQPSAAEGAAGVIWVLALPSCWTETQVGHCTAQSSQEMLLGRCWQGQGPQHLCNPQGSMCPSPPPALLFCASTGAAAPTPSTDTPGKGSLGNCSKLNQLSKYSPNTLLLLRLASHFWSAVWLPGCLCWSHCGVSRWTGSDCVLRISVALYCPPDTPETQLWVC